MVPYPALTSLSSSAGGPAAPVVPPPSRDAAAGAVRSCSSPSPRYAARTVSSPCTSVGVPTEMMRPKSSTWIRSHVPMTNDMSCSTSSTPSPEPATSRNKVPRVAVSDSLRPADGSSSSNTRGCVASARPSSTRRAVPVGSRSTRSSATACNPTRSRISSAITDGERLRSCDHPRRISAATRTFSRAVRLPNVSSRWNVRPIPSRARWWGLRRVMSRPSSSTRPEFGPSSPVMTLNSVVFPAPLGPISPVT